MKNVKILVLGLFMVSILGGCKQDIKVFEGNYFFVKKIDEADKSEKIYKKGDNRFEKGYAISANDTCLIATPVQTDPDGKIVEAKRGKALKLNQTDKEIFQYKKSDGSLVLTFIFSGSELLIDEYQKNSSGGFSRESRLECLKK